MRRRGAGAGGVAAAAPALALACGLLLVCTHAAAGEPSNGICQSIDVRSFPRELHKLRGCRVIEGSLSMVILERATYQDFANLTFPELREVTGFIMIYRMRGMRNLGDLFPNLSVVRGMQLFKDFAIVIFDCEGFEMLGLRSLTTIEHGAVRIQNNDRLCYTNTIDWSRIIQDSAAVNKIRSNYDARLCGLCPNAQSRMKDYRQSDQCPADSQGRLLCWDDKHCQKVCPSCGDNACMDDGKTCCHRECLGGCDGPGVKHCHVCRHFVFGYGENRTCTKACPAGFVELYRRCVSESECRAMTPPPGLGRSEGNQPRIIAYKIFNNTQCVWTCPSGYEERGDAGTGRCEPCPPSGCHRECPGGTIDSGSSSEKFKGCTVINGDLNISIRATGSNTMAVLESALGEIRVINGGLKVTRSSPLVSLMFLKNVERINAGDKVALNIFGNQNLELLWDWDNHKRIDITGRLYIHFNAKLCYRVIADLKNFTHTEFTEMEVSPENNGYQAPCFTKKLNMSVQVIHKNLAIFKWDMYCTEDSRKLLGYSLYYIATEHNVTLYGQRDACSETWNVKDITMDEVLSKNNSQSKVSTNKIDPRIYKDPCLNVQPVFYALNGLIPFTTYAAYVKTYTTLQDKKGAQSDIIYFKTLPGRPSPPQSLTAESRDPQAVFIKWAAPALPNGTIIMYHVEIQANAYNKDTIVASNTNFCSNPNRLATLISIPGEDRRAESAGAGAGAEGGGDNGTCACSKADKPATKFNSLAEEERRESIQFENELQNYVYIKQNRSKSPNRTKALTRHRRSVEAASLLSTLVILSGNTGPELGRHYANSTDNAGYVKSQYYELDGKTLSLTVNNMRHFTWYTVNVWACRERQPEESDEAYNKTWCSKRTDHIFRTMEMPSADVVRSVRVSIIAVNKTLPSVNVTWAPPLRPNGFVVAYNVHYSREPHTSQGQDVSIHNCVAASKCKNDTCGTILPNLVPGNYSVRVTPVTISGAGNESAAAYVFIEERPSGHEWIWGVISGCLVVVLVIGAGIWYAKRELLQPSEAAKLFASVNPEYVSAVYVPDEWEVPRTSIEFLKELGQGSFGMVYEGIAKNIEKGKPETRCAVKTVNEHATDRERIEFLNEASVMKAFDTFHVVRLLGVVSRGQPTLVVMELMELGDLKSYLRSHRPDAENSVPNKDGSNVPPTLQNILQMAIEIADGMAYLSAKKFVHRDLAARNCMVAGDLTVKVGDFGMTRDIYETDYYRKGTKGLLPVRWMSPESLKDGVFSSSSDAWSYGVVLWEMATLAMQPYQGLSNEQVVRYVVEGGVMERPEHCPDRLYELMRACWAHRPPQRPSFLHLVAQLAPHAAPHFRTRSFFHSPQGQELYKLQRALNPEEEAESEVNVGAVATGSGSNLFGVSGRLASGRLASWVRELSSLRSRGSDDAAAEPLQPAATAAPAPNNTTHQPRAIPLKSGPNGVIRGEGGPESTGC